MFGDPVEADQGEGRQPSYQEVVRYTGGPDHDGNESARDD